MKQLLNSKTLVRIVFCTFLAAIIYIAIKLFMAQSGHVLMENNVDAKSDYALMLLQCVLGMVVMLLPGILERKLMITIPSGMVVAFALFLFCAVYLGEVHYFYFRVPHWDTLLHTFSGFALGTVGFSIIALLNKSKSVTLSLSPAFVAIFAFCFAVTIGVVWEIYEFSVDSFSNLNMQKYILESGESLAGRDALMDTMKDLIVDSLGALVTSIVCYVSMKRKAGWLERMQIRRNRPAPVPVHVYDMVNERPFMPHTRPANAVLEARSEPEKLRVAI